MKSVALAVIGLMLASSSAFASTSACVMNQAQTSNTYLAVQWYRDSSERNAVYREVFSLGEQQIINSVQAQNLKPGQWGVIFDIDETLLDNSAWFYQNAYACQGFDKTKFSVFQMKATDPALPGAAKITCDIQKMGGIVSLISNRDGSYVDPVTHETLLQATVANLKSAGICFNQVLISENAQDQDKNLRFKAVQSGVYPQGMIYTNPTPAHPVLAYFGDNIQDFLGLYQTKMIQYDSNGDAYDLFGKVFFALPNPMYGSWLSNSFK